MNIIDSDLLSVQQARILLEDAIEARDQLKELNNDISAKFLGHVTRYFEDNIEGLIRQVAGESKYGKAEDELALGLFYLDYIRKDPSDPIRIGKVINASQGQEAVAIQKGVCAEVISPCLPVLTTIQGILFAIKSKAPIIIIPHTRIKNTIVRIVDDLREIALDNYYPEKAISVLKYLSDAGVKQIFKSKDLALVVENTLNEESKKGCRAEGDWFHAGIGNNIVFIEKTADISKAAKDIVESKAFNNGLLPGVEQSLVVETDVFEETKHHLKENGAYFLTKEESAKLEPVIYNDQLGPRKELIGRSAREIAKIAGIKVPETTKILVTTKPFVSIHSNYSKEKYHPILSLYIEDDWRHACEKCIELILNDRKGQSLSIYTSDSYVIEQFIDKKPVARVLVNLPTGFGSIGLSSGLPISFSLSPKQVGGVMTKSLSLDHFIFYRELGLEAKDKKNFDTVYRKVNKETSLFEETIKGYRN